MIRRFDEIGKDDVMVAGGKGANLGEMTRAGLPVPPGFVVTADAYRSFLAENHIDEEITALLDDAGADEQKLFFAAEKIRGLITAGSMPVSLKEAVSQNYLLLCKNSGNDTLRVAVRSSATAEDLPDASFAGQQETYLNIVGIDALCENIIRCYASLWGNRAVSYRQTQGYGQKSVALAVVVQEMVESEKAGVLFTANPVNNNRDEMQLNASYGLGEAVVSGKVTADTFICGKDGSIRSSVIGSKEIEIIYAENGTKEVLVSPERSGVLCLSGEEIKALCKAAATVENYYGCPMDIEWAIRGGNAYILQARAITTLTDNIDEAEIESYISKNKITGALRENFAFLLEKMPVAQLPLDHSFCGSVNNQKAQIFSEVGLLISMEPQIDDDGIMILPPNDKRINGKICKIFGLLKELKDLSGCREKCEGYLKKYQKSIDKMAELSFETLSLEQCGKYIDEAYRLVQRIAYARFKYALFPGVLANMRVEKLLKKISPDLTAYDLYCNLDYKTAVVTRDIAALADKIRGEEALARAVMRGDSYERVCHDFPDIAVAFETFMSKHGMKSDYNCYCIFAKSFIEDPDRLIHIIKPLINNPAAPDEEKFAPLMAQVRGVCGEKKFPDVERQIDCIRAFHVAREESQYQWETVFYYSKRILERAAFLCTGSKDIADSVAYLFLDEFTAMCKEGFSDKYREIIAHRKGKRALAEKVWERSKLCVFEGAGDVLKGVGGSSGEAVGRVCIVRGPEEFGKLEKGDILVCPYTDPEWTPLFKVATAVVADTGAALSHAAIVAREYGIPAVLGVGLATTRFKDGEMIRVNGSKGEVEKVG
ncbi:MAG: PEP-utilizing enzyme [Bacteroidales bacterium]|nr:PEP-utilizing enzyme [Lachnoclostridium sp.]MCM1383425.1 PEP-utilizing enzyme [Lachnoclostridium sp.]MCM1464274.1 PEP-utilizing enzyme [Bacteroidales bacterium]